LHKDTNALPKNSLLLYSSLSASCDIEKLGSSLFEVCSWPSSTGTEEVSKGGVLEGEDKSKSSSDSDEDESSFRISLEHFSWGDVGGGDFLPAVETSCREVASDIFSWGGGPFSRVDVGDGDLLPAMETSGGEVASDIFSWGGIFFFFAELGDGFLLLIIGKRDTGTVSFCCRDLGETWGLAFERDLVELAGEPSALRVWHV
jgi:hypothetical protein